MTQLNSKSIQAILQEALSRDGDSLKEMVRMLFQEIMEEERDQPVGVLSPQRDHTKRKADYYWPNPRSGSLPSRLNYWKITKEARKHYWLLSARWSLVSPPSG